MASSQSVFVATDVRSNVIDPTLVAFAEGVGAKTYGRLTGSWWPGSYEALETNLANENTIWDAKRVDNHSRLVARLAGLGIFSAYHAHRDEPQGGETAPTYFHRRRAGEPFHLDYVFLPEAWRDRLRAVTVGSAAQWLGHSDHCPMSVDVDVAGAAVASTSPTAA